MPLDTVGRILRLPIAGGASDPFVANAPLSSGLAGIVSSNTNHLILENGFRVLASHPGFPTFWAASPGISTSAPTFSDIDWTSPFLKAECANACLGSHVIHRYSDTSTWPRLFLRARILRPSTVGYKIGVFVCITPGRGTAPSPAARAFSAVYTSMAGAPAAWADVEQYLQLQDADTQGINEPVILGAPSGSLPQAENLSGAIGTVWFGCYHSGNDGGDPSGIQGVQLSLEP